MISCSIIAQTRIPIWFFEKTLGSTFLNLITFLLENHLTFRELMTIKIKSELPAVLNFGIDLALGSGHDPKGNTLRNIVFTYLCLPTNENIHNT